MVVPLSSDDDDIDFNNDMMAATITRGGSGDPRVKLLRSSSIATSWTPSPPTTITTAKAFSKSRDTE